MSSEPDVPEMILLKVPSGAVEMTSLATQRYRLKLLEIELDAR